MIKQQTRQLIVIGGGLLRKGETIFIDKYIVEQSGKKNPTVVFLPTASSDLQEYIDAFEKAYTDLGCTVKTIKLICDYLGEEVVQNTILKSDIIYIGGGDTDILLEQLETNNITPILKQAYENGVILSGLSAGCAIWYEYFLEKNENETWELKRGLGFLKGGILPHYEYSHFPDVALLQNAITYGSLLAIEDNCALHYEKEVLSQVVSGVGSKAYSIHLENNEPRAEILVL